MADAIDPHTFKASRAAFFALAARDAAREAEQRSLRYFLPALDRCARCERESVLIEVTRSVLDSQANDDPGALLDAYERAERCFARADAVAFVRSASAVVRALRRERDEPFRFLEPGSGAITVDEMELLAAVQAAIDGNGVAFAGAVAMLARAPCGSALARDLIHLADSLLRSRCRRTSAMCPYAQA
ncbi:MAG TPA: hypothetical protein PKA55_02405 [Rhodoblastus sp.]|nr:hypothetical protein [Rhodoblastus sp.]